MFSRFLLGGYSFGTAHRESHTPNTQCTFKYVHFFFLSTQPQPQPQPQLQPQPTQPSTCSCTWPYIYIYIERERQPTRTTNWGEDDDLSGSSSSNNNNNNNNNHPPKESQPPMGMYARHRLYVCLTRNEFNRGRRAWLWFAAEENGRRSAHAYSKQ